MQTVCLVLPLLAGQRSHARAFLTALDADRAPDYRRSQAQLGIDKEVWFLADTSVEGTLIAYIETPDFARVVERFAASREDFDVWFKDELAACTGLDLNAPPELALPEVLSTYASAVTA